MGKMTDHESSPLDALREAANEEAYQPPELTIYGSIDKLTQGGTLSTQDGDLGT